MLVKPLPGIIEEIQNKATFLPMTEMNIDVNIQDSIAVIKME